jgi:hypothetical protein
VTHAYFIICIDNLPKSQKWSRNNNASYYYTTVNTTNS